MLEMLQHAWEAAAGAGAAEPMQLMYMKLTRWSLRLMGMWPALDGSYSWLSLHWMLFAIWTSVFVGQVTYIYNNMNVLSFFDLGHCYITTLLNIIDLQRITLPAVRVFRDLFCSFLQRFHLIHHRHRSEYAEKVYAQVNRICTVFTYLVLGQMLLGATLFNFVPHISNFRNLGMHFPAPPSVRYQMSVYYWLPFDYQGSTMAFIVVSVFNLVLCYWVGFCVCLVDLYLSLLVFHCWGHFKILNHSLNNMPLPAPIDGTEAIIYSDEESRRIQQMLKDYIDHHILIIGFVDMCTDAFGPMLFLYAAFHQICLCILLLECSALDPASLSEYGLLTLILFEQLLQVCCVFELLGLQSELLPLAAYAAPWERMRAAERRALLLLLQRSQQPVRLRALGIVPVGANTAVSIIKTSVSYFFMLQTMSGN